jgi:hypothetical protein
VTLDQHDRVNPRRRNCSVNYRVWKSGIPLYLAQFREPPVYLQMLQGSNNLRAYNPTANAKFHIALRERIRNVPASIDCVFRTSNVRQNAKRVVSRMSDLFPTYEMLLKKRGRTWKWRVCTTTGDVIMRGSESSRPAARYKANSAFFLLLGSVHYRLIQQEGRPGAPNTPVR